MQVLLSETNVNTTSVFHHFKTYKIHKLLQTNSVMIKWIMRFSFYNSCWCGDAVIQSGRKVSTYPWRYHL